MECEQVCVCKKMQHGELGHQLCRHQMVIIVHLCEGGSYELRILEYFRMDLSKRLYGKGS